MLLYKTYWKSHSQCLETEIMVSWRRLEQFRQSKSTDLHCSLTHLTPLKLATWYNNKVTHTFSGRVVFMCSVLFIYWATVFWLRVLCSYSLWRWPNLFSVRKKWRMRSNCRSGRCSLLGLGNAAGSLKVEILPVVLYGSEIWSLT
jgi:hypothetical protein